jgi:hypothetical protein
MANGPPRTVDVTIRIEKAQAGRLEEVVLALEASGLTNLDVHGRFLMVSGTVIPERLEALRRVDGVASVREDRTYKVQPPRR